MTKWSKVSQKKEKKEGRQKKEVDKKSASKCKSYLLLRITKSKEITLVSPAR